MSVVLQLYTISHDQTPNNFNIDFHHGKGKYNILVRNQMNSAKRKVTLVSSNIIYLPEVATNPKD